MIFKNNDAGIVRCLRKLIYSVEYQNLENKLTSIKRYHFRNWWHCTSLTRNLSPLLNTLILYKIYNVIWVVFSNSGYTSSLFFFLFTNLLHLYFSIVFFFIYYYFDKNIIFIMLEISANNSELPSYLTAQ